MDQGPAPGAELSSARPRRRGWRGRIIGVFLTLLVVAGLGAGAWWLTQRPASSASPSPWPSRRRPPALRAARRNELQKSLNLALGSSLATIGLTIPAVSLLALALEQPLELGIDTRDIVLLVLTFAVSLVTFGGGRTNILPGFVHLVLFETFVFLIFVP